MSNHHDVLMDSGLGRQYFGQSSLVVSDYNYMRYGYFTYVSIRKTKISIFVLSRLSRYVIIHTQESRNIIVIIITTVIMIIVIIVITTITYKIIHACIYICIYTHWYAYV